MCPSSGGPSLRPSPFPPLCSRGASCCPHPGLWVVGLEFPVGFALPGAHFFSGERTWLRVAAMSEGLGHLIWALPNEENPAALVSESELTSHLRPTGQESGNFSQDSLQVQGSANLTSKITYRPSLTLALHLRVGL